MDDVVARLWINLFPISFDLRTCQSMYPRFCAFGVIKKSTIQPVRSSHSSTHPQNDVPLKLAKKRGGGGGGLKGSKFNKDVQGDVTLGSLQMTMSIPRNGFTCNCNPAFCPFDHQVQMFRKRPHKIVHAKKYSTCGHEGNIRGHPRTFGKHPRTSGKHPPTSADIRETSAEVEEMSAHIREKCADIRKTPADIRGHPTNIRTHQWTSRKHPWTSEDIRARPHTSVKHPRTFGKHPRTSSKYPWTSGDIKETSVDVQETSADMRIYP